MTLSFMEAAKGATKDVSYYANVKCTPCKGTGAKPGTRKKTCPQCQGTGQVALRPLVGGHVACSLIALTTCWA